MKDLTKPPTGIGPRPREFLDNVLSRTIEIRKFLSRMPNSPSRELSASAADALVLAQLIAQFCELGRKANAADAIVIAEKVEILIDQLWTEIDFILAVRTHRDTE